VTVGDLVSTNVRKYKLEVDTAADPTVPTWTQVRAVAEFKPDMPPNLEDDSDFDSAGWQSQTKTALAWTLEVKVIRKVTPDATKAYDPGQEKLRACALAFGASGVAHVRWYDRDGGPEAFEGTAEVTWKPDGGPMTATDSVTVTLTGKGVLNPITNPAAA